MLLMYHYEPDFDCNYAIDISGKEYLYGTEWRDKFLLRDLQTLPRFAHLARKVFMHYAGDHYNPHTINICDEVQMRSDIHDFIEYKIEQKTPDYDWEWLDHYFRKVVGGIYSLDLQHDMKRLKQGLKSPFKGKLHDVGTLLN